jgi:sugar O-acyltransferase (sialic acid O-acetyltransferase NeuD family)
MSALLILGAGGHARVVAETALSSGRFSTISFLDDLYSTTVPFMPVLCWPVIGPLAHALGEISPHSFGQAVVAIGHAATRLSWLQKLSVAGYDLPVLVHPAACVSPSARIGLGSVVFAQAVIQSQAMIGSGAILNTSCSVDHDAQLGDGVHICPGAHLAGEVHVGHRSWIGIGSSVIQQIHIGADVTVGAGAAVVRDLPDGVTAVGVPARVLPSS